MTDKKQIHVVTGGTVSHVAPHLALSAPAYGKVGRQLADLCAELMPALDVALHRTKMAGGGPQEVIDFIEANFELSEKTGGYVA